MGTDGPFVRRFITAMCRHTKGEWRGQPFVLSPWQEQLIDDLFELRPDGLRRYRVAYIGQPRKQGKSTLIAALGVYALVADGEPGAEVYSVAGDRQQARIVFEDAASMVRQEPELADLLTVYRSSIVRKDGGGTWRVLSADAKLQQGLNPSFVLFDEVHVQPNRDLWSAMTLGSAARRQPLVIGITTAGYSEQTLAYELYDYGLRLERGEVDDPTFFFRWWEPGRPDGVGNGHRPADNFDHTDPAVWLAANPALRAGVLKLGDFEALVGQTPENDWRRYRLNSWVRQETAWLPFGAWADCAVDEVVLDPALPVHIGVDASRRGDSTAVIAAQRQGERLVVKRLGVWTNPKRPGEPGYDRWQVDPLEVEQVIRDACRKYPARALRDRPGAVVWYDPAWFYRSASVLEAEGITLVEQPASRARWIPISLAFYEAIVTRRLAHDGDAVLAQHVANVARDERSDGWTMGKQRHMPGARPIDAAMACAMAVWGASQFQPQKGASVYEQRGIVTL